MYEAIEATFSLYVSSRLSRSLKRECSVRGTTSVGRRWGKRCLHNLKKTHSYSAFVNYLNIKMNTIKKSHDKNYYNGSYLVRASANATFPVICSAQSITLSISVVDDSGFIFEIQAPCCLPD